MFNFNALPLPDILVLPSYETLVAENLAIVQQLKPDYVPLESDDTMLLIEAFAYRELFLRVQMNNQLKSLLLPYAKGSDLDAAAVDYGVERLPDELDDAFRQRIVDSLDAHSTAGSEESYEYHARSVSAVIDDAHCFSPAAGLVTVAITTFDEVVSAELIALVASKLNQTKVRPITDDVTVVAATKTAINIVATIQIFDMTRVETLRESITNNFKQQLKIGQSLPYSQLIKNCHIDGVFKVSLTSHNADIACADNELLQVSLVNLTFSEVLA